MRVADELSTPWRAVEAMHWQLGEKEMARRAGVNPFHFANETTQRNSPSRAVIQPQPYPDAPREYVGEPSPGHNYGRPQSLSGGAMPRAIASRPDVYHPAGPPPPGYMMSGPHVVPGPPGPPPHPGMIKMEPVEEFQARGAPLAPIQTRPQARTPGYLPGVAELTTGVSPYNSPSAPPPPPPSYAPGPGHYPSIHQPGLRHPSAEPSRAKRRASSDAGHYEGGQRRRVG